MDARTTSSTGGSVAGGGSALGFLDGLDEEHQALPRDGVERLADGGQRRRHVRDAAEQQWQLVQVS
ncbi:hypothetical protein ACTMTJ_20820 [Phytohabitans sp. LJ34]|uniref:hypothetical protein n=1 Tax=Phytohabitans sp. LJ34 TaxID=3452217 RepID=UPI003F889B46